MPVYSVRSKSNGAEITRYASVVLARLDEFPLDQYDHVDIDEPSPVQTVYGGRRRVTKLEFIELLGDAAYGAILAMAKQSLQVEAWVKKMELATPEPDGTSIDLDDPRTQAGVQALGMVLEQQGVVSADWAEGVLRG
jgi:hypothetical protein